MKYKIFFVVIFTMVFVSCNHQHEANQDEKEAQKIQFTLYSTDFELFAEADSFVIGKTSNVLSHFSTLPNFKALESGSITISLIVNGKESKQKLEKPTRKGIYSFNIKPESMGKGKLIFDIKTASGISQLMVSEVHVYATEQEAIEAAEKTVFPKTNTTVFTKEQSWKIDFETDKPTKEPFGQIIKTTAQIQSAQGDEILVSAKINGIVTVTDNNVLEGKTVALGQTLFSISGNKLAENNSSVRFTEAQNNFEKTKADYERAKELANDKIVSVKDLLNAKTQYENDKAIFDNLKMNFSPAGQKITSPMVGFVKQLFVKNGQYVEAGQPIVVISQNKTLVLQAEVQQKYASYLGTITSATIRTLQNNQTYTLEQLNGKVLSYGRTANSDNYLIPVSLQIDNKGDFIPGGFVELYLKTLTNSQALTVPNSALLEEQGTFFVFVQITPELFEKREVKIGATDGLKTEIIKGVNETERVVSKGAILVKLTQASGALDTHSGHNH